MRIAEFIKLQSYLSNVMNVAIDEWNYSHSKVDSSYVVDDRKYTPSYHVHLGCKADCFNRTSCMICVVIARSIKSAFEENLQIMSCYSLLSKFSCGSALVLNGSSRADSKICRIFLNNGIKELISSSFKTICSVAIALANSILLRA